MNHDLKWKGLRCLLFGIYVYKCLLIYWMFTFFFCSWSAALTHLSATFHTADITAASPHLPAVWPKHHKPEHVFLSFTIHVDFVKHYVLISVCASVCVCECTQEKHLSFRYSESVSSFRPSHVFNMIIPVLAALSALLSPSPYATLHGTKQL